MAESESGPELPTIAGSAGELHLSPQLRERLAGIRLIAMDVDGVLTDGTIVWTARPQGGAVVESKSFSVKDGMGL